MSGASARRPTGTHRGRAVVWRGGTDGPARGRRLRRPSTNSDVGWSGSVTVGAGSTVVTCSLRMPSRCNTTTGVSGARCSRSVSFTSDSTSGWSHCATSIGPAISTSSTARPSRTRLPRHRVDAQPRPRQVGERHPRHQLDDDGTAHRAMAQQRHGALGHHRAARLPVRDVVAAGGGRRRRPCARRTVSRSGEVS